MIAVISHNQKTCGNLDFGPSVGIAGCWIIIIIVLQSFMLYGSIISTSCKSESIMIFFFKHCIHMIFILHESW